MKQINQTRRFDGVFFLFAAVASCTLVALIAIFFFLAFTGVGALHHVNITEFLFRSQWNPTSYHEPSWGIGAMLVGTLLVSICALVISVPLGIAVAIYLAEIASPAVREILKPAIEMIASIPSVVLGLIGLLFLAPFIASIFGLSNGLNALTAALLVALAAIPTIASMSEDALSSINYRFREASWTLGAHRWTTIKKVVLPAAMPGIIAACMLGLGRVVGETMIVLMVAGNSRALPFSLFDPVRPLTAGIAIEIKEVVTGSVHWQGLFFIGLILFLMTFAINMLADSIIHRTRAS